ncbi:alpha-glucuronidase A [Diplogelasinospora grovesii]|uniref:Alpha-glucuronidase n=1 Tax=Diplogelasinospora grovesii TaxID=303347 RepID=A0AAN6MX48_9PEZI|nr:alpha-glucuronidase A [Diplogelasinospora grovesii]
MHWSLVAFCTGVGLASAENGLNGWLRYASLPDNLRHRSASVPPMIVALNTTETSPVYTAGKELQAGIKGILGRSVDISHDFPSSHNSESPCILVGTAAAYNAKYGSANLTSFTTDGFWLSVKGNNVLILGQNERGALYGAFEYLSMVAQGNFSDVNLLSNPDAPVRWVNQWDNLDGSIERGYAGPSIFFSNGAAVDDLTRVSQYARLLSSIRINAVIVNNVNANASFLTPANINGLGRIADAMRPYGVRLGISLNFASPQTLGGMNTFDPLDPTVDAWWDNKTDLLYQRIPDMAGYLVKANSEGQPGPLTYNRTLADGANMFARALKRHGNRDGNGGIVMFRAFVYNNHINETDWKADRANAAVDFFKHLDGQFEDNVVVQIKYGPIDFQVREPTSPLFANLFNTSTAIELQITQEYLGQQAHVVYLPPLWKTVLDFDLRVDSKPSLVRDIVSGQRFSRGLGGYAGVVNVGTNTTWLGSHMAMSNLYAYGRLAWDPALDPQKMLEEWTRLTFGFDRSVMDAVTKISMASWPAYENYTGNLGIQTLNDPLTHFGPNPAAQDNNGWGQWTRADRQGIGMDRTVSNGTGFAGQYPPEVAKVYENIDSTPDDLLLWFHHVNYTYHLRGSGETVIQHFYNAHYAGAETAQTFATQWESLRGKMDDERFNDILFKLKFQAGHSIVWRDAITGFYHNLSGIPDSTGRVGHHPWRMEAESMMLQGYRLVSVDPPETASNGTAIVTTSNSTAGSAVAKLPDDFKSGQYDIAIGYFDVIGGRAHYGAFINDEPLEEWIGDLEDKLGHAFSKKLDGSSATRITIPGIKLEKGDVLKIVGAPDGIEQAPLDYIALIPANANMVD